MHRRELLGGALATAVLPIRASAQSAPLRADDDGRRDAALEQLFQ